MGKLSSTFLTLALTFLIVQAKAEQIEHAGFLVEANADKGIISITLNGQKIIDGDGYSSAFGTIRNCVVEKPDSKTLRLIGKSGSKRTISISKDGDIGKCTIQWELKAVTTKGATAHILFTSFINDTTKITLWPQDKPIDWAITGAKKKNNEAAAALFTKIKENNYVYEAGNVKDKGVIALWHKPLKKLALDSEYQGEVLFDFEIKDKTVIPEGMSSLKYFLFQINAPGTKFGRLVQGFSVKKGEKKFLQMTISAEDQDL